MRVLVAIVSFAALSAQAQPKIIFQETRSQKIASLGAVNGVCRPGLPQNGHNFPTASTVLLKSIGDVMPTSNTSEVGLNDPKLRLGDHCDEFMKEVEIFLPGEIKVTRTLTQEAEYIVNSCVNSVSEEIVAELGTFQFHGSSVFKLETLPDSACGK